MLNLILANFFYRTANVAAVTQIAKHSENNEGRVRSLKRNEEERYHGAQLTSRFNKALKPAVCYHFPHKVSAGGREEGRTRSPSLCASEGVPGSRSRGGQRSSVSNTVTFPDE